MDCRRVNERCVFSLPLQVIDGHYPHVMPHSSNLSFWEKGMTSDIGHTWIIGMPCFHMSLLPLTLFQTLPPSCLSIGFQRGSGSRLPLARFLLARLRLSSRSQFPTPLLTLSDTVPWWYVGHKRLGNSTELGWEGLSQNVGSASKPNGALYQQMYSEGQRAQWGSF